MTFDALCLTCGTIGLLAGESVAVYASTYVVAKKMQEIKNGGNTDKVAQIGVSFLYGGLILGPTALIGSEFGWVIGASAPITVPIISIMWIVKRCF